MLLGRKAMTNLDSVLKSRDITLLTKVHKSKLSFFPAVIHGWEIWTINKADHWRTDVFDLWCWRGLLRFPWTTRRSNQSILNEMNPEYSPEGLMLKLQYFSHLMQRAVSLEKTLMLRKIEGRRRRGWQRTRWLDIITDSMDIEFKQIPRDSEGQGSLVCWRLWGSQRVRHDWVTEKQPICDAIWWSSENVMYTITLSVECSVVESLG